MEYQEAVRKLYALSGELAAPAPGAPRRKFELDHMRTLAAALGNPQKRFPSVLIAGTNGKGSTAATLASILSVCGYRTGLYTSPHLLRVNERIQIGVRAPGQNTLSEIEDEDFARIFTCVEETAERLLAGGDLPHSPSFFEVATALAFVAFAEAEVDIAVLEVGLGGRLDATNIVDPLLSVITDIALDHTEWLGGTLADIAREKAGILRPLGRLVTLPQHPEANTAIGEVAMALGVTGISAADCLPDRSVVDEPYTVRVNGQAVAVSSPLQGDHQHRNLALALATAGELASHPEWKRIDAQSMETGIRMTRWPARLEAIPLARKNVTLLLDVAHNPAGAWALRGHLSRGFERGTLPEPRTLIFSAFKDKPVREMAQILFPLFEGPGDRILLSPVQSPRATSAEALAELAASLDTAATVCGSVAEAMAVATGHPGSVIVCGSVYLAGEAKAWLKESE